MDGGVGASLRQSRGPRITSPPAGEVVGAASPGTLAVPPRTPATLRLKKVGWSPTHSRATYSVILRLPPRRAICEHGSGTGRLLDHAGKARGGKTKTRPTQALQTDSTGQAGRRMTERRKGRRTGRGREKRSVLYILRTEEKSKRHRGKGQVGGRERQSRSRTLEGNGWLAGEGKARPPEPGRGRQGKRPPGMVSGEARRRGPAPQGCVSLLQRRPAPRHPWYLHPRRGP
ncbi:hypothetical protein E2C01_020458 [Portunus trituberculatus]|uniref:Uncharacterized protein n=1 Tax=Portunus trituberculatus TaxID=210409 RepID=A0A5B7E065_PORTR|nr:hypothetical protein [Portunus trituberculatus]